MEQKGIIFNIQRFSIHDGPGIRTTIFIKGCPLRCLWCSNPESQKQNVEIMSRERLCIGCGKCVESCPHSAITIDEAGKKHIDRAKCKLCKEMACVKACPSGALEAVGKYMSIGEVVHEVSRDTIFYQNSGGGVTISGGEPLVQPEFVYGLLRECKAKNLHTALDTCGYAKWPVLQRALEYTDLVLYDIKHLDPAEHKKLTGVNNELILSNLEKTKMSGARIWLRCPVITGYNDSETEFEKIAKLALSLEVEKVSLLPFFKYGEQKYEYLGREYFLKNVPAPTAGHVEKLAGIVRSFGVEATVGY